MALLKKLEQLFISYAFGGQKVVSNFFSKPLEQNFILKKNRHITLSKVVNNLMVLYIGTAVSGWHFCPYAFSSALMSNFFIPIYTSITFCAFVGSLKSFGSTVGTICQDIPNLSFNQPQLLSCPPSAVRLFQ